MKIEILTRNTDKKADLLTYLRGLEGFEASSGMARAAGVEAEITEKYILLTVSVPWVADQLIRRLFTVRPAPFAQGFYEIAGDIKIIATCAARPIGRVLEAMDVLEHLDLEAGELAGRFDNTWNSRDVSVTAAFEVMVQGGVAVARVKFGSHFRDSEYNCRKAVAMAGISRGLSLISSEDRDLAMPAVVSPVALTASSAVSDEGCATFLNRCPGMINFLEAGEYRVDLPGGSNHVTLSGRGGNSLLNVTIYLEAPWSLDHDAIRLLGDHLNLERAEVGQTISGLTLSPDDLLRSLGFVKERDFLIFRAAIDGLEALYDIGRRHMKVWGSLAWNEAGRSWGLFSRIADFTARVIKHAV